MAKWGFHVGTFLPVAVADAANFTDAGHASLQGGSATQRINIEELYLGGQASASAPSHMQLARHSTVGATPTALASPNSMGPLDPSSAALAAPPVAFVASTTKPQRSSSTSLGRLNLSFNAFGGIVRWMAMDKEPFSILGNTASLGEAGLSHLSTGTPGQMGAHMVFEPL